MRRRTAVTLLEMLVVSAIILIGGVVVAKMVGHSLRLGERAQARTELVALAQSHLDRLRIEITENPWKPEHIRILSAEGVRMGVHHRIEEEGLLALTISLESLRSIQPLRVTLTGWVPLAEAER